jgi:hypothetical protein
MRTILIFLATWLIAFPAAALTESQAAYIDGMNIGWELSYARGSDPATYNALAQKYNDALNATMNSSEASLYWLTFASIEPIAKGPVMIGSGKSSGSPGPVSDVPRIRGMPAEAYYSMGPSDAELASIASSMGIN